MESYLLSDICNLASSTNRKLITDVFEEKSICCEILNFLPDNECDSIVSWIETMEMHDFANLDGIARRIGLPVYEMTGRQGEYFKKITNDELTSSPFYKNLTTTLLTFFKKCEKNIVVAKNKHGEIYCPGVINEFHSSLKLHYDLASNEQKGWFPLEKVHRQFAYGIRLTDCQGGETVCYPQKFMPNHSKFFNHDDGYSYNESVIEGIEGYFFPIKKGSLIIFNTSYYHKVLSITSGKRYTFGGFIGELPDQSLVMWG